MGKRDNSARHMLLLPAQVEVEGVRLQTNTLLRMADEPMDCVSRRTMHCFPTGTLSAERLVWAKQRTIREAARRAELYRAAEGGLQKRLPEGLAKAVLGLVLDELRSRELRWPADF